MFGMSWYQPLVTFSSYLLALQIARFLSIERLGGKAASIAWRDESSVMLG